MTFANVEQAEFWSSMAPTRVEIDQRLEATAGDVGRMAMDRLEPSPDQRLLDLGCGTGSTTVELAGRVGPGGAVVGVDIAEEMLMAAWQRAVEHGVDNISFVHADVQAYDLGAGAYDGAFSRFGVMFYADPAEAFSNIRGALRDGGRLSFACWQEVFANEWMLVPGMAVMSVTGTPPPMPEPGEPGPFSLSDPDRVRSLLTTAGYSNIEVARHNDALTVSEPDIPEYADVSLRVGAAREALKDADDELKRRARQAVIEALRGKVENGQARLTRGVLLVTATA